MHYFRKASFLCQLQQKSSGMETQCYTQLSKGRDSSQISFHIQIITQTTLCKTGHILPTGYDLFPNWKKLGLLIIVTQGKMSPWHDVLIFHLRNGGFYEQTQTLLLPLSLLFPFWLGCSSLEYIPQTLTKRGGHRNRGRQLSFVVGSQKKLWK